MICARPRFFVERRLHARATGIFIVYGVACNFQLPFSRLRERKFAAARATWVCLCVCASEPTSKGEAGPKFWAMKLVGARGCTRPRNLSVLPPFVQVKCIRNTKKPPVTMQRAGDAVTASHARSQPPADPSNASTLIITLASGCKTSGTHY